MTRATAEELLPFLAAAFPHVDAAPFGVDELGDERLVLRLRVGEEHLRPGGTVSGPTLMTLADTAAWLLLVGREGVHDAAGRPSVAARSVTASLSIHFLRKPEPRTLVAEAKLLKAGRRLSVIEVAIRHEGAPAPVVHATVTYASPAD